MHWKKNDPTSLATLILKLFMLSAITLVTACGSGSGSSTDADQLPQAGQATEAAQATVEVPQLGAATANSASENGDETAQAPIDNAEPGLFESSYSAGFTGEVFEDGSVYVSWPAVADARGYNVYKDSEYVTTVFEPGYTDSQISKASHYYEVVAFDHAENYQTVAEGLTVELAETGTTTDTLPPHIAAGYDLVFAEEFQTGTLDTTKWNTSYLWGDELIINSEEQFYVDIKNKPGFGYNPFELDGEHLTITAIRTPPELLDKATGQPYLSGVITSYDSFKFTYGYVEARAKVPFGQGLWSAFWLLNAYYVDRKPEIDIFEHIGDDRDVTYHTYHYYDGAGKLHSTKSLETVGIDFTHDFHNYAVEWLPGKIIFYVDGQEMHSISDPNISSQEMYIIANTALGGWWPGSPDDTTPFPSRYQIDYIRAYQKRGPQEDAPLDDGTQTIPLADDVPSRSPNHIPTPEQWPQAYPEM